MISNAIRAWRIRAHSYERSN